MKVILIGIIHLYWIFFPKNKRRACLFNESCSHYTYRITKEKGLIHGMSALKKRYTQCRPGYTLYKDEQNNSYELQLKDGSIVSNEKIAQSLLPPFNFNYIIKNN